MLPQAKQVIMVTPASFTNGATATGTVDVSGYKFAMIDVIAATSDTPSDKPSVLKLQHGDTTDATNLSDLSGFVGGTDFTIANADSSVPNGHKLMVDLRGKKKILKILISPRTTQIMGVVANLFRGDVAPNTASRANVLNLVEG